MLDAFLERECTGWRPSRVQDVLLVLALLQWLILRKVGSSHDLGSKQENNTRQTTRVMQPSAIEGVERQNTWCMNKA